MTLAAWFVTWVAVLAVGGLWVPAVAAQWATVRSPVYFLGHWALVAVVAAGSVHFGQRIATLQRELRLARRLAGYRLQARISAGGMNEVWLAWDEQAKRDVALKILHGDPSPDEARRFQREAEALRALDDEHTVRVLTGEAPARAHDLSSNGSPAQREHGMGAQVLRTLGLRKIRLMTNNPRRLVGLTAYDLEVVEQVALGE
jgi:hypothetical protein